MRKIKFCRIIGFTITLLFLAFFAIMVIGEEFSNIKNFTISSELIIPIILWFICFASLFVAFKHPRITGLALILAGVAWFFCLLNVGDKDNFGVALLFGLIFFISGILFVPWRGK